MINKSILKALNDQIRHELYSSYLYLAMSAYSESKNLPGFARWLEMQSKEEYEHGMKIYTYIHERNGEVILQGLETPPSDFKSPLDLFKQVLGHEQKITASINKLYELAEKESDYPTQLMLQWFIKEQVEEEKNAGDILDQLKLIGDSPMGLMMVDHQLGARGKD